MTTSLARHYLDDSTARFYEMKHLADAALAQLSDDAIWRRLEPESNSIAVLMKHLAGNMRSRWMNVLSSDGEKPWRQRDDEFVVADNDRAALFDTWESGWQTLFGALASFSDDDLLRTTTIRGEPHTVLEAINRQLVHYAQHVGQLVLLAKHDRGDAWRTLSIPKRNV